MMVPSLALSHCTLSLQVPRTTLGSPEGLLWVSTSSAATGTRRRWHLFSWGSAQHTGHSPCSGGSQGITPGTGPQPALSSLSLAPCSVPSPPPPSSPPCPPCSCQALSLSMGVSPTQAPEGNHTAHGTPAGPTPELSDHQVPSRSPSRPVTLCRCA